MRLLVTRPHFCLVIFRIILFCLSFVFWSAQDLCSTPKTENVNSSALRFSSNRPRYSAPFILRKINYTFFGICWFWYSSPETKMTKSVHFCKFSVPLHNLRDSKTLTPWMKFILDVRIFWCINNYKKARIILIRFW